MNSIISGVDILANSAFMGGIYGGAIAAGSSNVNIDEAGQNISKTIKSYRDNILGTYIPVSEDKYAEFRKKLPNRLYVRIPKK